MNTLILIITFVLGGSITFMITEGLRYYKLIKLRDKIKERYEEISVDKSIDYIAGYHEGVIDMLDDY